MDKVKLGIASILNRMKSKGGTENSIKTYWRLIMISYLTITLSVIVLGWLVYGWAITTTSTVVRQKRIKPSITMEEIRKASDILVLKRDRLEAVILQDIEVVGLR